MFLLDLLDNKQNSIQVHKNSQQLAYTLCLSKIATANFGHALQGYFFINVGSLLLDFAIFSVYNCLL